MKKLVSILSIIWVLQACENSSTLAMHTTNAQAIDSLPGGCPFLTKDQNGNTVLSWIQNTTDSSSVFCYAVSKDGGNSFGTPVQIPGSQNVHEHSENIPKVIFKPSGEIIAIWGAANPNPKNKYSGVVYYAQSFDNGKNWSAPKQLVTAADGFDQRYFDVALLSNGEAAIIWLDNRKVSNKEGSALYMAATNGSSGFSNEKRIQEQCCPCCRTEVFVDSKDNLHILYRGIINDTIRDMVHTVSVDGGKSFSTPERISNDNWVISGCPHTGPAMAETKNGLHFAWFTGGQKKGSFYTSSTDNGKTFLGHDSISTKGAHSQLCALSNGEVVAVWDETVVQPSLTQSRIGIQKRNSNGRAESKSFIADGNARVSYPVVAETKNEKVLVAYCQEKQNKDYVMWQLLNE